MKLNESGMHAETDISYRESQTDALFRQTDRQICHTNIKGNIIITQQTDR